MSGPVGLQPRCFSEGFEIVDLPNQPNAGKTEALNKTSTTQANAPVEKNSFLDGECCIVENDFDVIDGKEILQGAEGKPFGASQSLTERLRSEVPKRRSWNLFSAIGRGFMNLCHSVRCVFSGGVLRSRRAADHADFKANSDVKLSALPASFKEMAYSGTNEQIGAALGLRGKITLKPFPSHPSADQIGEKKAFNFRLYGGEDAGPKLSDIKQDPSRQDCWFLSSITSILRAKGPEAIKRLIQLGDTGDFAIVRLGRDHYRVPLGELCGNGGRTSSVSGSAPWVKLLETAMAMHLANRPIGSNNGMDRNVVALGLCALLGHDVSISVGTSSPCHNEMITAQTDVTEMMAGFSRSLAAGEPVMLSSSYSLKRALASGISPGHAVTLLDVNMDAKVCTVLDPYGHTRNVAFKDLVGFTALTVPSSADADASADEMKSEKALSKGNLDTFGDVMLTEQQSQYEAALKNLDRALESADDTTSLLKNGNGEYTGKVPSGRENTTYTLSLKDNAGEGNCFFYAALHGNGVDVTAKSTLALKRAMTESTLKILKTALEGKAGGLKVEIDSMTHVPKFNAKYTDVDGVERTINLMAAVKENVSGRTLEDRKEVDTLNAAFLAHHLKRPVVLYQRIADFSEMLVQKFDYDLETGEKFDSKAPPLNLYYAGGDEAGHFQTITDITKKESQV